MTRVRDVGRAALRGVREWPGVSACVLAYAGTVTGLYWHREAQLFGLLAALAVGIGWYSSPVRNWEANRRRRGKRSR